MRRTPPPATVVVTAVLAVLLAACGAVGVPGAEPTPAGEEVAGRLATDGLRNWGCGHAFTVGTTEQDTRLSLWFDASAGELPEPGSHELGEDWTGELVTGSDLFAQWCDDVITPDEPEVVEAATWEVDGTLTWQLEQGDGECPSVATARLTDATVDVDGEAVPIADVEFRNEHFGCVAG